MNFKPQPTAEGLLREIDRKTTPEIIYSDRTPDIGEIAAGSLWVDCVGLKAFTKDENDDLFSWVIVKE